MLAYMSRAKNASVRYRTGTPL